MECVSFYSFLLYFQIGKWIQYSLKFLFNIFYFYSLPNKLEGAQMNTPSQAHKEIYDKKCCTIKFTIYFMTGHKLCKVEFNQSSYWLYSVPNLLVFQHLVTLYLGGFVVRVVSEIECWLLKNVQENKDSRLDLAGDSRLQAARRSTRAKHARRWIVMLARALQDKTGQLAIRLSRDWSSRLSQVARPSCEPPLFCKT